MPISLIRPTADLCRGRCRGYVPPKPAPPPPVPQAYPDQASILCGPYPSSCRRYSLTDRHAWHSHIKVRAIRCLDIWPQSRRQPSPSRRDHSYSQQPPCRHRIPAGSWPVEAVFPEVGSLELELAVLRWVASTGWTLQVAVDIAQRNNLPAPAPQLLLSASCSLLDCDFECVRLRPHPPLHCG